MPSLEQVRSFEIILTTDCNLSCRYCYQNAKKRRSMPWETLKTSLDLAFHSSHPVVNVVFLGGEPLLEFPLLKQAVVYIEKNRPAEKQVIYHISTNGTLLNMERLAFLNSYRFKIQISFDGVAAAQDNRGPATFPVLDRLLDLLRKKHAEFLSRDVTVSMTVTPTSIIYLAASVAYFLKKSVRNISIRPIINAVDWEPHRIEELDDQFGLLHDSSLRHWQKTGEIPLLYFRYSLERPPLLKKERLKCALLGNEILAVDVDGHAYGCALLAGSFQAGKNLGLLRRWLGRSTGNIHDPAFAKRHAASAMAAKKNTLLDLGQMNYSAYGQCRECRYVSRCLICPGSAAYVPGNIDPNRVSDFYCAWNRVSLKYRDRFLAFRRKRDFPSAPRQLAASMERWKALMEEMAD